MGEDTRVLLPVQRIEDVPVPLPVQWIRAYKSCFLFDGAGRTSPVLLPDQWIGTHESCPVSCSMV
jgi:hypothetical protein